MEIEWIDVRVEQKSLVPHFFFFSLLCFGTWAKKRIIYDLTKKNLLAQKEVFKQRWYTIKKINSSNTTKNTSSKRCILYLLSQRYIIRLTDVISANYYSHQNHNGWEFPLLCLHISHYSIKSKTRDEISRSRINFLPSLFWYLAEFMEWL